MVPADSSSSPGGLSASAKSARRQAVKALNSRGCGECTGIDILGVGHWMQGWLRSALVDFQ